MASLLAEVKENFLSIANKGWFLPGSTPTHALSKRNKRGGSLGYREAAVLALISYHKEKLHILLTKRSSGVSFKGDACLPGGTKDSGDTSMSDTALREATEEVGLNRQQVEVICTLPPQRTRVSGVTVVTPVVALTKCTPEELNLSPNPTEVDCLYWVPLELFLNLPLDGEDTRAWWHKTVFNYVEEDTEITHVIYGLTALFCVSVASVALNRLPNFPYEPRYVTELVKRGDMIATIHSDIALTQQQAAKIQHSKL